MSIDLNGQVAVVTGASRGIGRAIALAMGRAGAFVIPAARSTEGLAGVTDAIEQAGGEASPMACDVAEEASVLQLFESVRDDVGRLDVLVNNAGIGLFGDVVDFETEDFDRVMAVNARGTFLCCREAMKIMTPRSRGTIINISSVVGFKGYPHQAAYTASKHAIMGLTKSLAAESSEQHIRVAAILPGGVDTDLVAQARPDLDRSDLMQPEDIASAVMFLLGLSDRCWVDEIYIRRRASSPF